MLKQNHFPRGYADLDTVIFVDIDTYLIILNSDNGVQIEMLYFTMRIKYGRKPI